MYPADRFGCGHFRMIHPARVLKESGLDIEIIEPGGRDSFTGHYDESGEIRKVTGIPEGTDVVVMQRVTHGKLSSAVSQIRRQGIAVVIDMDDDLSCIHPSNPAYHGLHPRAGGEFSWRNAAVSCRDATLVTTSTAALAGRYPSKDGGAIVLDNYVPSWYLDVEHTDTANDVAYAGSLHSHPDDVPQVGFAVEQLGRDGSLFRVVGGAADGFAEALGLPKEPATSGALSIEDWPSAVAGIGVGIAPLADTRFNAAKSRLKVLEMSALGVPWVASPRVEYERFHRETGVGFLARRPRDWYRRLSELTSNAELRAVQSAAGREATRGQTYEANAWRWWEAWNRAYAVQHGWKPATFPGVR